MRGRINLILAAILVLGTLPQTAFGFVNPLKSYNLYEDTHPKGSNRDNVMSQEFYHVNDNNSNTNTNANPAPAQSAPPKIAPTTADGDVNNAAPAAPQRRNDYLRQSSKKVYGSGSGNWSQGPYFYPNPTMKSIRWKYHISNFAGCMQECEAYVQKYPSDTLGYYYLAMSYAKCGDKDNAIRAYERVISLNANPMIVKYATNGRNCVMGNESEQCYQDVNIPELKYPYRDMVNNMNLTPVDPQTLVNRNLAKVRAKLSPAETNVNNNDPNSKDKDKSKIIYNERLSIANIPAEAYEYIVNGKSALEWVMERYAITTDKESGIKNDPNDWAIEHNNPSYIFDLVLRIITVSVETVKIVKALPKLKF